MYKMIIADDEYEIRHGLSEYFPWKEIGFEVVSVATNGKEVLDAMEEQSIDALLCDIRMPIMDGIEVAKTLHETKSDTIIVFLSGYEEFEYARLAIDYGVRKYVLKPTKFSELSTTFQQIKEELDFKKASLYGSNEIVRMGETSKVEPRESDESDIIISKIIQYVKENLHNVNLDEAASIVYMNPHYVSKYFKQKTGINFSDYVFEQKMMEAGKLLQNLKYKIYEVSEMVGYGNSKNFTRAFRRYYELTPTEYRGKQHGTSKFR